MGMSASQCRLLTLTARLSDLEYQAQVVSNAKISLAQQTENVATKYSEALDQEKLTVYSSDTNSYVDANAHNLTTYQGVSSLDKQRFLKTSSGQVLVSSAMQEKLSNSDSIESFLNSYGYTSNSSGSGSYKYDSGAVQYYTNLFNEAKQSGSYAPVDDGLMYDSEWLYEQLNNGTLYLENWDYDGGEDGTGDFVEVPWQSGDATLKTQSDDSSIAKAQAEYDTEMARIEAKDKKFDLELKQIDTEHTAVQTEIDSVKKVIDKNIDRSFKIFDA